MARKRMAWHTSEPAGRRRTTGGSRCYTIQVDGAPVRVQGAYPPSPETVDALTELMRAAVRHVEQQDEQRQRTARANQQASTDTNTAD